MKEAPRSESAYTILIVDDVPQIRRVIAFDLQTRGYNTVEAGTGAEALVALAGNQIDLVLLDVMMPEMDGFAACEKIRGNPRTSGIPVILVTAKNEKHDIVQAAKHGASGYVVKPFTKKVLLEKVRSALEKALPPPRPGPS